MPATTTVRVNFLPLNTLKMLILIKFNDKHNRIYFHQIGIYMYVVNRVILYCILILARIISPERNVRHETVHLTLATLKYLCINYRGQRVSQFEIVKKQCPTYLFPASFKYLCCGSTAIIHFYYYFSAGPFLNVY